MGGGLSAGQGKRAIEDWSAGELSEFVCNSSSLRAFIDESNRGKTISFLADMRE
jgi:hypothetical protein